MQRQEFDADSSISESELQTRHLRNSNSSSHSHSEFISRMDNKIMTCCGPYLGKIFLTHKAMWICIILTFIYYGIGIAYYASVEKWTLDTNIYFITIAFLVCLFIYIYMTCIL